MKKTNFNNEKIHPKKKKKNNEKILVLMSLDSQNEVFYNDL